MIFVERQPILPQAAMSAGMVATTVLFAIVAGCSDAEQELKPAEAASPANTASIPAAMSTTAVHHGFLYGRITTVDDDIYEGRLRWGGDQEAFWNDYFDGAKKNNPWAAHAPLDGSPDEGNPVEIFGFKIGGRPPAIDLGRPFMTRFGDIARVEAHFAEVQVTVKSGTAFVLNRFEAGDIDDGVRVWDGRRGVVDLDARQIRTIEFSPTTPLVAAPARLHGTVRTRKGDFTGFIQWDRQDSVGLDELNGRTAEGELNVRFDAIRSIARHSHDSALVTRLDGRELVLSKTREVGHSNRGISVDDKRFGRVVIGWNEFVRVDFSAGDSGPAYDDFAPGRPLTGSVTTRAGRRLSGRLVYDFDESETTDTFDGAFQDVSYTIPFALIASIVAPAGDESGLPHAKVILHSGAELPLDRTGDLGDRNAGMLVFIDGAEHPEYVRWRDVAQIDLYPSPR
jgi:hypothetical protein